VVFRGDGFPAYLAAANRGGKRWIAIEDACRVAIRTFPKRERRRLALDRRAAVENAGELAERGGVRVPADTAPKLINSPLFPPPSARGRSRRACGRDRGSSGGPVLRWDEACCR